MLLFGNKAVVAELESLDKNCVIKEISTNLSVVRLVKQGNIQIAVKTSTLELVEREVEILEYLGHRNGLPLILGYSRTEIYFEKLNEFGSRLDLLDIRKYFGQLVSVLDFIHGREIAHLDISPGNLMLNDNDSLVLIDFQLARKPGDEIPKGCGTPGYIAPEIFNGCNVGYPADIYSAGVILGSLLEIYIPELPLHNLGSQFMTQRTTDSINHYIRNLDATRGCSSIIKMVAELLEKMLEADPIKRISAKEILKHPFLTVDDSEFDGFTFESFCCNSLIPTRNSEMRSRVVCYRG